VKHRQNTGIHGVASLGGCDFLSFLEVCGRKTRKSICQQSSRVPSATLGTGSSTPRHKTLCYALDLRGASLRMTSFSRGLKISGRVQKRGKVEKVTGSQDDKGESGASIGFGDTEGSTAGPSTSLRSGRDDNSYFGMGCECPRKIVVLIKKSQALRMTPLGGD
jgi:hypothetical protein